MPTIAERLVKVRRDLNMNQVAFSKLLHISRPQLGNLETGKREINEQTLHILCTECNVNEKWLLTGAGEPYNQAVIDGIELAESVRGINPSDPHGDKKVEMFQLAAMLLHQFKRVSYSCENIEEMLTFFSYPSFANQLGYILSIYSDAQNDPSNSLVTLKLFNALFEQTFDLTRESKRLKSCGKERAKSFEEDYLTQYAEDYYREILQPEPDDTPECKRSVSGIAAAGVPLYDEGDAEETVAVPPKYLDRERYFIVKAKGDSMEPMIMDGDYVVVEHCAPPSARQIALVRVEDNSLEEGYTIKRFVQTSDEIELLSINKAYKPMVYPLSALRSAERVVHIIRSGY